VFCRFSLVLALPFPAALEMEENKISKQRSVLLEKQISRRMTRNSQSETSRFLEGQETDDVL